VRDDIAGDLVGNDRFNFRAAIAGGLSHKPCAPGHGEVVLIMRRSRTNSHIFI
jgi:hypothetical protein